MSYSILALVEEMADFNHLSDSSKVVIQAPDGTRYQIRRISDELMNGKSVVVLYADTKGVKP